MILMVHAVRVVTVASMNFSHLSSYPRKRESTVGVISTVTEIEHLGSQDKIDAAAELQHQPTQQPLFLSQSYDEWMEYRWIDGCGMEWREGGREDR